MKRGKSNLKTLRQSPRNDMEWININSIESRVMGDIIFVTDGNSVCQAICVSNGEIAFFNDAPKCFIKNLTHWMPWPKPPKE